MGVRKIAISIPEEVLRQVDRAAKDRHMTRSRFISRALARIAQARRDAEITRRIDEVLSDPELAREQAETARAFQTARSARGTEW
ncbi:MAG: type II toxin-antitoxin system HicB family antitoxin [Deltaproteobacteria bacterium]|nr:type II toxin-antitoxin system HicB family antitoxin [Deltaproteobacteria bacterium]